MSTEPHGVTIRRTHGAQMATLLISISVCLAWQPVQAVVHVPGNCTSPPLPGFADHGRTIHRSESGRFSLAIVPSRSPGHHGTKYSLRSDGELLWEKTLPYTLSIPFVTNSGIVTGTGYRSDDVGKKQKPSVSGDLRVVVLDRTGNEVLNEVHKRPPKWWLFSRAYLPFVRQQLVDEDSDLLMLHVADEDPRAGPRYSDFLWFYRLSDGTVIHRHSVKSEPLQEDYSDIVQSKILPGSGLVLHHWLIGFGRYGVNAKGGAFQLVRADGTEVWSIRAAGDYDALDFEKGVPRCGTEWFFREHPAIVEARSDGFTIRFFSPDRLAKYTIHRDGADDWIVQPAGREQDPSP